MTSINARFMNRTLPLNNSARRQRPARVSVLMPTFRQGAFITRALNSLVAQTMRDWQLIVVDDGSTDDTQDVLAPWTGDARVTVLRNEKNQGLGAAVNRAMDQASAELIAYLPSDDVWTPDHLASLVALLEKEPEAVLAYSGIKCKWQEPGSFKPQDLTSTGQIQSLPLQMAQVMHRRTDERWVERSELTTDDLDRMFWNKLRSSGEFVGTGTITADWVSHPQQRHKLIREPHGGINPYRAWCNVEQPLIFHSSVGNPINEVVQYEAARGTFAVRRRGGLRIVLAGALAFSPDRVVALAEAGHELYGLWAPDEMHWFNTVGPSPFGHIKDIPLDNWEAEIERIQPDLIYAMLNYQVVPFVHDVLKRKPDVPMVWHFKEGPFDCIANGTWPQLVDLCTETDGQIYSSPEMKAWIEANLPKKAGSRKSMSLDGDLPSRRYFTDDRSERLSAAGDGVHAVVAGQPLGMTPELLADLAERDVHVHMYGDFYRERFAELIASFKEAAGDKLHLHPSVTALDWVKELSKYDAGFLHLLPAHNGGDLQRAEWADLNYPARMATLASAGLPFIQFHPEDNVVAAANLARRLDIGVFYRNGADLADQLWDGPRMRELQANVWKHRDVFTFDHHVDRLTGFFRNVVGEISLDEPVTIKLQGSRLA